MQEWIRSWWTDGEGKAWRDQPLHELKPEDWFSLHENPNPRLWIPLPAAMETVVEMFNEDRLAHLNIPHVFTVPRLMTHLWRKPLSKDADVVFTIRAGTSFWPASMHEPLILMIVLPLNHVPKHRGPWTLRGSQQAYELVQLLDAGFKSPSEHGCKRFYDLEEPVPGVRKSSEAWSRNLLFEFLAKAKIFPPVSGGMVRGMLCASPRGSLPNPRCSGGRGGKRGSGDRGEVGVEVSERKKRRPHIGHPL